jgi:glycosyltransferase involved in cell wall biosynthesis
MRYIIIDAYAMKIGIDISAALRSERTGVEEYVFYLVKSLALLPETKQHTFFLYIRSKRPREYTAESARQYCEKIFGFSLPEHFIVVPLFAPSVAFRAVRLSLHFMRNAPDVLFMTAHVLPILSPRKTVVMVHGLEYERVPRCYSFPLRQYLRFSTRRAGKRATAIITPSASTKNDLIALYGVSPGKITVVYHGRGEMHWSGICPKEQKYIIHVGRVELKKNILGLLDLFEVLKSEYALEHRLVLVGGGGFGYDMIKEHISRHPFSKEIVLAGYVSVEERNRYVACADLLVMPSFYEGFGFPVVEAQQLGTPVVCSNNSSMVETAKENSAVFIDPLNITKNKEDVYRALSDIVFRQQLIEQGRINAARFHWEECARQTFHVIEGCRI